MVQEKAAEIIDLNASRQTLATGETAGVFLANARRAAGLSHARVAEATKIKPRHLKAIEACDAGALPAPPYAVGFVKVYAGFLGLDAEAIAAQFKSDIAPPDDAAASTERPQAVDEGAGVRLVSIAAIVVIFAFVAWIAFQVAGGTGRDDVIEAAAGPPLRVTGRAAAPTPRPQLVVEQTSTPPPEPSIEKPPLPVAAASDGPSITPVASDPAMNEIPQGASALEELPNALDVAAVDIMAPAGALRDAQGADLADALSRQVAPAPYRAAPPRARRPAPVIIEPKLIRSKAPHYPNRCERKATERETVTVFFDVTPEGRTANARAGVSSNACFNQAALRAIAKWRFEPETANGVARLSTNRRATLNFQR